MQNVFSEFKSLMGGLRDSFVNLEIDFKVNVDMIETLLGYRSHLMSSSLSN